MKEERVEVSGAITHKMFERAMFNLGIKCGPAAELRFVPQKDVVEVIYVIPTIKA